MTVANKKTERIRRETPQDSRTPDWRILESQFKMVANGELNEFNIGEIVITRSKAKRFLGEITQKKNDFLDKLFDPYVPAAGLTGRKI